jgi:hypothetical protein
MDADWTLYPSVTSGRPRSTRYSKRYKDGRIGSSPPAGALLYPVMVIPRSREAIFSSPQVLLFFRNTMRVTLVTCGGMRRSQLLWQILPSFFNTYLALHPLKRLVRPLLRNYRMTIWLFVATAHVTHLRRNLVTAWCLPVISLNKD